jgi:hypothetical protein
MWGWPEPDFFHEVDSQRGLAADYSRGRAEAAQMLARRAFVAAVRVRVKELCPHGYDPRYDRNYGESYADPSRPGDINNFNDLGIVTAPAANQVYKGIDTMRMLLKVNPSTGRARHYFDARCKHAIEETRKYRWVKKRQNALYVTALPKPVPLKKDDDTCDSDRYCCHTVELRRGLQPSSTAEVHDVAEHRGEVQLERAGKGRARGGVIEAGANGFFQRHR